MALDGDSLLLLKIHGVQDLVLHVACREGIRHLKHSVRQSALAMVDMRNDAKISCLLHFRSRE